jgi:hypothetical protein
MKVSEHSISNIIRQYTKRMQKSIHEERSQSGGLQLSNEDSVFVSHTAKELLFDRVYKSVLEKSKQIAETMAAEVEPLKEEIIPDIDPLA